MTATTDKQFIAAVTSQFGWNDQFAHALDYARSARHPDKSRPHSIDVARRALEMGSDRDTVIATLISHPG